MSDTTANSPVTPIPAPTSVPVATPVSPAPAPAAAAVPAATATVAPPAPAPAQPVKFIAKPMKIGVVPFLNAQPLIWDMKNHHQLFPVAPNEMGGLLKQGRL